MFVSYTEIVKQLKNSLYSLRVLTFEIIENRGKVFTTSMTNSPLSRLLMEKSSFVMNPMK